MSDLRYRSFNPTLHHQLPPTPTNSIDEQPNNERSPHTKAPVDVMSPKSFERATSFSFANEPWPSSSSSLSSLSSLSLRQHHREAVTPVSSNDNEMDDLKKWKLELVGFEDVLPVYRRDNEFIRTGYIQNAGMSCQTPSASAVPIMILLIDTASKCMKALFHVHNETGNIWIHIVGGLIFFGLFLTYAQMAYYANEYFHQMGYIVTGNICVTTMPIDNTHVAVLYLIVGCH
jgi:hypothetical protein